MSNPANENMRKFPCRGVVARELRDLEVGMSVLIPYKYSSLNNIKVNITNLRSEGFDFTYTNDDDAFTIVTRTV